jgi:hypothetical protein
MKEFNDILHRRSYTNNNKKTMTLIMDGEHKLWFHHSGINTDFDNVTEQLLDEQNTTCEIPYKLSAVEKSLLKIFTKDSMEIISNSHVQNN